MKQLIAIAVFLAVLPGCTTTLYGSQTSGGGSNTTTTGSSVRGSQQIGNARLSDSFGAPPPAGMQGGQVTFSNNASAVLFVGMAIAGLAEVTGNWFSKPQERREPLAPGGISHTCSCYGWSPELLTPAPEPQ
jgi:hypothetical protein